jgi:hypothetical protein
VDQNKLNELRHQAVKDILAACNREQLPRVMDYLEAIERDRHFLTSKVLKYEKHLENTVLFPGQPPRRPFGVQTPEDNLPSHVHRNGKEPLVSSGNGVVKSVPPARDDHDLGGVEDLAHPAVAGKVDAQQVPGLEAAGVKGGELGGGAERKESCCWHVAPGSSCPYCLTGPGKWRGVKAVVKRMLGK